MAHDNDKNYTANLVRSIREADYLCDVTLVAGLGKRKFPVHRNVMVASSPYFKAMLGPNNKKAKQNEIVLPALSGPTLKEIVNFCYSGLVCLTKKNVHVIMAAASRIEFVQLKEKCADFLRMQLNVENSAEILLVADQYNLAGLRNKAMRFICENFDKVPTTDMVKLDAKMFGKILKKDNLDADETEVFDCFVKWTKYDAANRSQFIVPLAESIRLGHIPTEFLNERVEPFFEKHGCGNLVLDEWCKRTGVQKPIELRRFQPALFCADLKGIRGFFMEINIFKYTDEHTGCFEKVKTIPVKPLRKNWIFSAGKAYLFDDAKDSRDMESYDLITFEKEKLPKLPVDLKFGTLISKGKHTYVLGKYRLALDCVSVISCYRYDSERKLWEIRKPLPHGMKNLSAIELDGLIYVVGNIERTQNIATNFWCYDPKTNEWFEKANCYCIKLRIDLIKVNGSICVCDYHVGFMRYDDALNSWIQDVFVVPLLDDSLFSSWQEYVKYLRSYDEYHIQYDLHNAIDLKNESYGLIFVEDHYFLGKIIADEHGYRLAQSDLDPSTSLFKVLDVSREKLHLFVK